MKKFVVFDEQGFPSSEYAAPPESHALVEASLPLRDPDGRWLRPDGSYAVNLAGVAAFGGEDGRQPVFVPAGHWGEDWPFFANLKSTEHPYGVLREPRPETTAERRAREKAEADAAAAIEAARVAAITVPLFSIRKVFRSTVAADGQTYLTKVEEARANGTLSEDAHEAITMLDPVRRSSPYVAEFQTAFGFTSEEVDALFVAAEAVPV